MPLPTEPYGITQPTETFENGGGSTSPPPLRPRQPQQLAFTGVRPLNERVRAARCYSVGEPLGVGDLVVCMKAGMFREDGPGELLLLLFLKCLFLLSPGFLCPAADPKLVSLP